MHTQARPPGWGQALPKITSLLHLKQSCAQPPRGPVGPRASQNVPFVVIGRAARMGKVPQTLVTFQWHSDKWRVSKGLRRKVHILIRCLLLTF